MDMKKILFIFIISTVFLGSGCMKTHYNPATGQQEYLIYSTAKEVKLGKKVSKQLEKKYPLSDDVMMQQRVKRIGETIAKVSDRQDIRYHFAVIEDEDINAIAIPGGFVYVSSGLVEAAPSDAELAAVIAHEVGHIAAYHSMKKMQGDFLYTFLSALTFIGESDSQFHRGRTFAYISVMMDYSRDFEEEADKLSVKYLEAAGYDPEAAVRMLELLEEEDRKRPQRQYTYFRTHPPVDRRIAIVRKQITGQLDYESYLDLMEAYEY